MNIVDITPRPPRRRVLWLGVSACVLALVVATWLAPAASRAGKEQETHRLQAERSAYLVTLCMFYDEAPVANADREREAGHALCDCVQRSTNPAKDCNNPLRVWVVMRDAERCASGLREEAPRYCACVEPVGQLVSRATGMDVARRRAYRYDECRALKDVPTLPPPPRSALASGGDCEKPAD